MRWANFGLQQWKARMVNKLTMSTYIYGAHISNYQQSIPPTFDSFQLAKPRTVVVARFH
jgi:hypothetical protein